MMGILRTTRAVGVGARVAWTIAAVCAWSVLASASVLPRIAVLADVSVQEPKIHLGHLLTPESRAVLSSLEELDNTVVGLSPPPGKTRVLESREIYQRLAAIGITTSRYTIQIPDLIRVQRQAQDVSPADIEDRIKSDFLPGLPWNDIQLEEIAAPKPIALPLGNIDWTFQYPPRTDLARPFYLNIIFRIDGQIVERAYLRTTLKISDTVAVAARELDSAAKLAPADVRWEKRVLDSTLRRAVSSDAFFENRKTRSSIASGQIVTEEMFVVVPLIKRGDSIVLVYEGNKIHISVQGQSLTSGSKGDRIRVMNLSSRKELVAEIVDQTSVRVVF